MRNFLKIVGFLLLATSAFAQNNVLLKREVSGGNPPPSMIGWANEVVVYENGDVYARHLPNSQSNWQEYKMATISADIIQSIKSQLADLEPGVISYDENQPLCYDLPSTHYYGSNAEGEEVMFAARSQCREGRLQGFYKGYSLHGILDGLNALTSYLPELN